MGARRRLWGFRWLCVALGALMASSVVGLFGPIPAAWAANIGSAPQTYAGKTGVVEICNVDLQAVTFTNQIDHLAHFGYVFSFACNWGSYNPSTPVRVVEHAEFSASDGSFYADSCMIFCIGTNRTGYSGGTYSNSDNNGCNNGGALSARSYVWSRDGRWEKGTSCTDEGTSHATAKESLGTAVRYFENNLTNIPTSGNETSCTCGTFSSAGGTSLVVRVNTTATGAIPSFPADYFADGTAADATNPAPVCDRTLYDTTNMLGEFHGVAPTAPAPVNAAGTQGVWAWGDGSSNTTLATAYPYNVNHTYPAIGTMPQNGWTATLTVTYTTTSGHAFPDGSTTKTATCSMRVDFLHPDQTTPASSGGDPSSGGTIDNPQGVSDCEPSGWGWLNPVSLIKGAWCLVKLGFIPSSTTTTGLGAMWTSITTKAPFSVLYEVVTWIPANMSDFVAGVNATSPVVSHGVGGVGTSPICEADGGPGSGEHGGLQGLCNYSGQYPFQSSGNPFRVDGGTGQVTDTHIGFVRTIFLFFLGILFLYACYRGVGEILK